MRVLPVTLFSLALFAGCENVSTTSSLTYPSAKQDAVEDDFHGTKVADPYRWLEEAESPDTKAWLEAQKALETSYFSSVSGRDAIRERLKKMWDYPKFNVPVRAQGHYWFMYNDGMQEHPSLMKKRGIDTPDELVLDPKELSDDGTASIGGFYPSEYSEYVAYIVNVAGSDWQEIEILDTKTNEFTDEILEWVKFSSIAWTGSGNGFYYCRYDAPPEGEELTAVNSDQKIFYHKVGTDQSADTEVVVPGAKSNWFYGLKTTADGRYLIIHIYEGTGNQNRVYYRDIAQQSKVIQLIDNTEAQYEFIDNEGPVFYFKTTLNAPLGRVVSVNIGDPRRTEAKEVIAQTSDVLEEVVPARGQYAPVFVAHYLSNAFSKLTVYDKSGKKEQDLELPTKGTVGGLTGYRRESNVFFSFQSFAWPQSIFLFDAQTGKVHEYQKPKTDFDVKDYDVEQVFVTSTGGAQVPMFIVKKSGVALGGNKAKDKLLKRPSGAPALMYGYGGFNVNITPTFSPATVAWLEMGGIYVLVNLRGGNEFGEDWHKAGMLENKQNVFDDFIAAGEWLVKMGYTSPKRLAVQGGSNGGLLVGAVTAQRPDLFGAAIPQVGVMDMLRYHKFTIGWAWATEYGRSDDPKMFPVLYKYSPLHNLKDGTAYPATLIMTSDHDDRVVPAHSYKYAARLQAAQGGGAPIVLRVESNVGHGSGTPVSKQIEGHVDRLAFLAKELGVTVNF